MTSDLMPSRNNTRNLNQDSGDLTGDADLSCSVQNLVHEWADQDDKLKL